jgi:hypothetical protein
MPIKPATRRARARPALGAQRRDQAAFLPAAFLPSGAVQNKGKISL